MDQQNIKQAEAYLRDCRRDGRLQEQEVEQVIIDTYQQNKEESLELAQELHENSKSVLWTIVTSYYAMFYSANAALARRGYRIKEPGAHKTTYEALIALLRNDIAQELLDEYEDTRQEALALIETYDFERKKRGTIQYETTDRIKRAQANTSYERARRFCTVLDLVDNQTDS